MKYFIYLSTTSIYFQPSCLQEMLTNFRARNTTEQITGLLLFSSGQFLQFIEGEDKKVDRLIRNIKKDVRHHSLIVLESGLLAARIFPDWSMSFKDISQDRFANIEGFVHPVSLNNFSSEQITHPVTRQLMLFASRMNKTG